MKESKGGTFAPADIKIIDRALGVYQEELMTLPFEQNKFEFNAVANLRHRLKRIGVK